MAKVNRNIEQKELIKLFKSIRDSKGSWEVWNDTITMIACALANACESNPQRREKREKMYINMAAKYTGEELKTIQKIFSEIVNELETNADQDLLGDLYMGLEFGNKAIGQFFTPYSVCQVMSGTIFNKESFMKTIKDQGFITFNEPACGAGATIIALLNEMKRAEINYQEQVLVAAQDLSQLTALMCYIHLSLLGAAAVVVVGDTLRNLGANSQTEIEIADNVWLTPMYYSELWQGRRTAALMDELITSKKEVKKE